MVTSTEPETIEATSFIVCGLGSLGQYCVALLKEFGVSVSGIDSIETQPWEIPNLPQLLDQLLIGDCRQPELLERAKIQQCRAILLVTSDERVNIAAAFAARSLNPQVRLVIRSAQENLNDLLAQHLGNFAAYEATQLPASAFALAALGNTTQGFFSLDGTALRVVQEPIQPNHRWCDRRQVYELNTASRRVLDHAPGSTAPCLEFYQWEPHASIQAEDTLTYIETTEKLSGLSTQLATHTSKIPQKPTHPLSLRNLKPALNHFWRESQQTQRVGILSSGVMLGLFLLGTALYKLQYPDLSLKDALNLAIVLLLGGFDNLFGGGLKLSFPIPGWLYLFSILMTVAGTVFIGILYAILTERVLAARFQFMKRRPPVPKEAHVVLIGLGRVGQAVAKLMQELKHPLVGVNTTALDPEVLPQIPLVTGKIREALTRVNLATAKSVMVVTDDEVANLEIGLMVRTQNPHCQLVLRTFDLRFGENVARLLPDASVLRAYALAAEAFVGAAFGENILNLFRLNDRTTLVTEYQIEADDTLTGKLLAEIAYGYGVVPILHQKSHYRFARLMPSDDVRLQAGDRLVVLATIEGLQRVEQGKTLPPTWQVQVETALSQEALFEGATTIARVSGCDLSTARTVMEQLPATLPTPLYRHQAIRLVRELSKAQVKAQVVEIMIGLTQKPGF
ncbi:NAD-binding protein [Kovacikia minuta CCNUW1]|uniref:potassium channel family protein n=1 Tax=Kovacikia minuta TaxID=2931930 RepID=UPI001CCB7099|nr:potassium channel protein [Kovacikia minuta]UBF25721.1 NAD-binding protein [Kovacikia minuta CCNUW1]